MKGFDKRIGPNLIVDSSMPPGEEGYGVLGIHMPGVAGAASASGTSR